MTANPIAARLTDALARRLAADTLAEKRAIEDEIADILRGKPAREAVDVRQQQIAKERE